MSPQLKELLRAICKSAEDRRNISVLVAACLIGAYAVASIYYRLAD